MAGNKSSELPPGFRFHPTDEELIMYYLRNQATSRACPAAIIPEVDIYKFDPWELPEKTEMKEKEWYFFTPRDRKYPNGVRPNRAAVSGYWKATGTDKSIYSGSKYVGIKKALVFYKGRPPKGTKTDWIMHEYRLSDSRSQTPTISQSGSMRLDDWVLCRIYKKKNQGKALEIKVEENQRVENVGGNLVINEQHQQQQAQQQQQAFKIARQCSLSHLWESEYMESMSLIFPDNSYNTTNYEHQNNDNNMVGYNNININGNGNNNNIVITPRQQGEVTNQSSSLLSQQQPLVYMNHDFNFQ